MLGINGNMKLKKENLIIFKEKNILEVSEFH